MSKNEVKKSPAFKRAAARQQSRAEAQQRAQEETQRRDAEMRDTKEALRLRQQADAATPPKELAAAVKTEIVRASEGAPLQKKLRSGSPLLPAHEGVLNDVAAQAVANVTERLQALSGRRRPSRGDGVLHQDGVKVEAVRLWRTVHYNELLKKAGIYKTVEARRIRHQVARDKPEAGALQEQVRLELALYNHGGFPSPRTGTPKPDLGGHVVKAFEQLSVNRAGLRKVTFNQLEATALEIWRADRLKKLLAAQGLSRVVVDPPAPREIPVAPVKVRPPREKKKSAVQREPSPRSVSAKRGEGVPNQTILRRYATVEIERFQAAKANPQAEVVPTSGRVAGIVAQAVVDIDREVTLHNNALPEGATPRRLAVNAVVDRAAAVLRQQRLSSKAQPVREPLTKRPHKRVAKKAEATETRPPDSRRLKRHQRQEQSHRQQEAVPTAAQVFNTLGRTLQQQAAGVPQLVQSLRREAEGNVPAVVTDKALKLATYLKRHGTPQRALSLLTVLSQKAPQNGEVQLQLGFALRDTGHIPSAIRTFSAVMEMPGMHIPALTGMAETYLHADRPRQALTLLERHAPPTPDRALEKLRLAAEADLAAKAGNTTTPRSRLRLPKPVVEEAEPEAAPPAPPQGQRRPVYSFNLISQSSGLDIHVTRMISLGAGMQALAMLPDEAIATQPEALQSCGDLYMAEGDTRHALKAYNRAIVLKPDNIKLRLSAAEAAQGEGDFAASNRHLHHVLGLQPRMSKARALLATGDMLQAHKQGDKEQVKVALGRLEKVQQAQPHRADLAALRSRALLSAGEYQEAITMAANFKPDLSTLRTQLEFEQVAVVHANSGLARLMRTTPADPMNPQDAEAAFQSFAVAKETISLPLLQQGSKPVKGFNVYSNNLLIKLTNLQIEAADRGHNKAERQRMVQALDSLKADRDSRLERGQELAQSVAKDRTVAKKGPEQRMV